METVEADLTSPADLQRVEDILRTNAGISMLVNNAGVGATAPLVASDVDKMDDMIRLNVTALTRLTYAAVPGFVARGNGTIINIASVVAIAPELLNGVYGGTKAFVLALNHSLVHELADKGIRVQAVLPGATATEFWDVAGTPVHQLPAQIVMSADDLVDAALAGLDLGETVTIPSLANKAEWDRHEAARRAMSGKLSSAIPAPRYNMRRRVRICSPIRAALPPYRSGVSARLPDQPVRLLHRRTFARPPQGRTACRTPRPRRRTARGRQNLRRAGKGGARVGGSRIRPTDVRRHPPATVTVQG